MSGKGSRCRNVRKILSVCLVAFFPVLLGANGEFRGLEERLVALFEEHNSAMVRVKAVYPPDAEAEGEDEVPQVVIGSAVSKLRLRFGWSIRRLGNRFRITGYQ